MSGLFLFPCYLECSDWDVGSGYYLGYGESPISPCFLKLWRVFFCVCYLHKRGSFLLVSGLCYLGLNLSGYQFLSCWWVSHPCLN